MSLFGPGAAIEYIVVDAQGQQRTRRDVPIGRVRPRVPAKADGRRGTRRAWKRLHPPRVAYGYREPTDMLTFSRDGRLCIVCTPSQRLAIEEYQYQPASAPV
jgi:hypothetical protein